MAAQLSEKEQKKINKELWESAEYGDIENVKGALKKGANLKYRDLIDIGKWNYVTQITPHTVAYINGHNTIVEFLENAGAIPDYGEIMIAAAVRGQVDIVKEALKKNANINRQTQTNRNTALHKASSNGHKETVQFLLTSNADPNIRNKDWQTALHLASKGGYCDITQLLLNSSADPNSCDVNQNTALHLASLNGYTKTVQFLLQSNADPNIYNKWGHSPLHLAHWYKHDNIVKILCSFGARDMDQVRNDDLLLTSAENGNIENVTQALTSGANVNVHHDAKFQQTSLHLASERGYCDIVQLLLNSNADPNIRDEYGRTPAHYAAENGHVDALRLLITVGQADINVTDDDDNNLLHLACVSGNEEMIHYLLYNVQLNPDHLVALNNRQQMPVDRISPYVSNSDRFRLLKLFQPFKQCHRDYLTESYAKLFLCGKTKAGKSSLAAVISYRAKSGYYKTDKCVEGVVLQTTGIEYHSVRSWEIGNVVIFDFAGHAEYYSSHAAVLETLLLRSPAVFAILSNLTDDEKTIEKDLLFWFNFVENVSMKLISSSQVLVLGSHVDELSSEKDFQPFVNNVANLAVRFQNYKGCLPIDCHRPGGKGVDTFMEKLRESCEAVVDKNDKMSYHCHCLNSYLQQLEVVAISLYELCSKLMELNEPCLLTDRSIVLEFLTILGSKGLILFLANTWVIIDKKTLLTEVNGVLFNKNIDRERKPVASNTGVMPVSTLANFFPNHNTDMLIRFLTSLQFCHQMNSYAVSCITNNIPSDDFPISKDENFLFFPALITEDKPTSIFETTDGFGWCLWCPESRQFLSMRFLHTLLHRLAYTCCPPLPEETDYITDNVAIQELQRLCIMWKNGIYWKDENNLEVMVEVTEDNRCVTVLVSHSSLIESYQLRASLIKEVLKVKNELCPCTSKQFAIAPGNIKDVMEKEQKNRILYALRNVAKGVVTRKTVTSSTNESIAVHLVVGEKEPYLCIAPLLTKALFTDTNKDLPLPDHYVQHIEEVCGEIMSLYPSSDFTYLSVREHLNKYSIFAGRNPLSIPSPPIKDDVIQRLSKHVQTRTTKDFINPVTKPDEQMSSSITYNVGGGVTQTDKNTYDDQTDECAKESSAPDSTKVSITDNLSIEHQQHSTNELSSEHKPDTLPSNTTQQDTIDPSEIFLKYFADICDAIEVKPLSFVNQLYSAKLLSLNFKKDVESMSGDNYDKANKVVNELQRQVEERGIEFLNAICYFLLKHNQDLRNIGKRMKSNMVEGGVYLYTLPDDLLDQQPKIEEVTRHARTSEHNQLGVTLQLDSVKLAGCHDYTSMYQLWIMEKAENATRRNLLVALRDIGQNNVARKYEEYLETIPGQNESAYSI